MERCPWAPICFMLSLAHATTFQSMEAQTNSYASLLSETDTLISWHRHALPYPPRISTVEIQRSFASVSLLLHLLNIIRTRTVAPGCTTCLACLPRSRLSHAILAAQATHARRIGLRHADFELPPSHLRQSACPRVTASCAPLRGRCRGPGHLSSSATVRACEPPVRWLSPHGMSNGLCATPG